MKNSTFVMLAMVMLVSVIDLKQCESCTCIYGSGDYCGGSNYLSSDCNIGSLYHCGGRNVPAALLINCPDSKCDSKHGLNYCHDGQPNVHCTCLYGSGDFCGGSYELSKACTTGYLYHCAGMNVPAELKNTCSDSYCNSNNGLSYCNHEQISSKPNVHCTCLYGSGDFCGGSYELSKDCTTGYLYHCAGMNVPAELKSTCTDSYCNSNNGLSYCNV